LFIRKTCQNSNLLLKVTLYFCYVKYVTQVPNVPQVEHDFKDNVWKN